MYNLISCEYSMDTGCVELGFWMEAASAWTVPLVKMPMLTTGMSVLNLTI